MLEALACEIPVIVRDIPVYGGWLTHGKQVWKAKDLREFQMYTRKVLRKVPEEMQKEGRKTAEERDLEAVGMRLKRIYQTVVAKNRQLRYDK